MYTQVLSYILILNYAIFFGDIALKLVYPSWDKSDELSKLHVQIISSLN
jgi:hypothetical protein